MAAGSKQHYTINEREMQREDCGEKAPTKSEMLKKSSVDMEDVFRRKKEAKNVLAKVQTTRDKRSRKPVLDMSLPWAGKF